MSSSIVKLPISSHLLACLKIILLPAIFADDNTLQANLGPAVSTLTTLSSTHCLDMGSPCNRIFDMCCGDNHVCVANSTWSREGFCKTCITSGECVLGKDNCCLGFSCIPEYNSHNNSGYCQECFPLDKDCTQSEECCKGLYCYKSELRASCTACKVVGSQCLLSEECCNGSYCDAVIPENGKPVPGKCTNGVGVIINVKTWLIVSLLVPSLMAVN